MKPCFGWFGLYVTLMFAYVEIGDTWREAEVFVFLNLCNGCTESGLKTEDKALQNLYPYLMILDISFRWKEN
jgi:hypothetical protein